MNEKEFWWLMGWYGCMWHLHNSFQNVTITWWEQKKLYIRHGTVPVQSHFAMAKLMVSALVCFWEKCVLKFKIIVLNLFYFVVIKKGLCTKSWQYETHMNCCFYRSNGPGSSCGAPSCLKNETQYISFRKKTISKN